MKSAAHSQLSLPPMPVHSLDGEGESHHPKSGLPEISLEMAKAQIGGALRKAIAVTDAALKEFGDPSHVNRVCDGEIPGPLARAWQRVDSRRELVKALADSSGLFDVRVTIDERRSA